MTVFSVYHWGFRNAARSSGAVRIMPGALIRAIPPFIFFVLRVFRLPPVIVPYFPANEGRASNALSREVMFAEACMFWGRVSENEAG